MSKKNVLAFLYEYENSYVSGETISKMLGVSRNSVWKSVESLRKEGYEIESKNNMGYKLKAVPDEITTVEVKKWLSTIFAGKNLEILKSVGSTNTYAKSIADEGAVHGTAVVAEEQTKGRGRLQRHFISQKGKGIYMSLVLKPSNTITDFSFIVIAASLAVRRAIYRLCGIKADIKWTNDLLIDFKKVCGILTEVTTSSETGSISSVILGIGVNVNNEHFPPEIEKIASSLYLKIGEKQNRSKLLAFILNELDKLLLDDYFIKNKKELLDEYKNAMCILNRQISYKINDTEKIATAVDIDETGGLVVKTPEGRLETIKFGEISIRSKNNE